MNNKTIFEFGFRISEQLWRSQRVLIASADYTFFDLHNSLDHSDTQPHSIFAKYSANDLCRQFHFLFPLHLLVCPLLSYYIKLPTH